MEDKVRHYWSKERKIKGMITGLVVVEYCSKTQTRGFDEENNSKEEESLSSDMRRVNRMSKNLSSKEI